MQREDISGSAQGESLAIGQGLLHSLPIVWGYLPVAFSFGVAATRSGLTLSEAVILSAIVYSGASQFIALTLFSGGASVAVSIVTLLLMNVRHLLYAPTLLSQVKQPQRQEDTHKPRLWALGLTDEVFAAAISFCGRSGRLWSDRWMAGLGLGAYLAWVIGTMVGALAGESALEAYPAVDAGLRFMLPALFLALLLSIMQKNSLPIMLGAGLVCMIVGALTSLTAGVLSGMFAGALTGMLLGRIHARRRKRA